MVTCCEQIVNCLVAQVTLEVLDAEVKANVSDCFGQGPKFRIGVVAMHFALTECQLKVLQSFVLLRLLISHGLLLLDEGCKLTL